MATLGRPTLLDDLVAKRICDSLAAGNAQSVAARTAGVAHSTLRSWLARGRKGEEPYASFLAKAKKAESVGEAELVGVIRESAQKTWQCAAWLLERRIPQRWARKDAPEPRAVDVTRMSPEQFAAKRAELEARWAKVGGKP